MSAFEIIIGLAAVAMLSSYLYVKRRQRVRSRSERYDPPKWTGKPIDVTKLKPALEAVRRDYPSARQSTRGIFFHRSLLGLARRAVARLAYFHDRASEEPAQTRGP
jgi:hypothetical protein